ncbi:hypothetical protein [Rhizobium halophytocola]|uniref:Uncharacterized protein n=1 Tax=Rhizobium halophytocola TaxID=735519 RepID=A0ABS4DVI2_9HYPH|nr:hypothetical protein [Rhizobium halophytocola]MBP1849696.1 hypothetical protein [Rhizobium halophytocola]
MTLREIKLVLDACAEKARREHDERAWLAWHTARLTAYAPEKPRNFIKLEKLFWRKSSKNQSSGHDWRAVLAKVQGWVNR